MKTRRKSSDPRTNADLRRFVQLANKRYFGGTLQVAKIEFSNRVGKNCHGKTETWVYEQLWGPKETHRPVEQEMYHIIIHSKLKYARDLCMMTVYHEMVHAELMGLGFRGKDVSCKKSAVLFNRRMTELAQAGAFNGLW
jgi:hypothetical protein